MKRFFLREKEGGEILSIFWKVKEGWRWTRKSREDEEERKKDEQEVASAERRTQRSRTSPLGLTLAEDNVTQMLA